MLSPSRSSGAIGRRGHRNAMRAFPRTILAALGMATLFGGSGWGRNGGGGMVLVGAQMIIDSAYGLDATSRNSMVPLKYACDAIERDVEAVASPPVSWTRLPAQAQSFVLLIDDLDNNNTIQWLVKDLPAASSSTASFIANLSLPEDASGTDMPAPAVEMINGQGFKGYAAPCSVGETHRLRTRVFALATVTAPQLDVATAYKTSDAVVSALIGATADGHSEGGGNAGLLVVAAIVNNVTIPPPPPDAEVAAPRTSAKDPPPSSCGHHGIVPVIAPHVTGGDGLLACSWHMKSFNKNNPSLAVFGKPHSVMYHDPTDAPTADTGKPRRYTAFAFECLKPGIAVVRFALICAPGSPEPAVQKSNGRYGSKDGPFTVDEKTVTFIVSDKQSPADQRQIDVDKFGVPLPFPDLGKSVTWISRYLKPSEVVKPSRPHVRLEAVDKTPCKRGGHGTGVAPATTNVEAATAATVLISESADSSTMQAGGEEVDAQDDREDNQENNESQAMSRDNQQRSWTCPALVRRMRTWTAPRLTRTGHTCDMQVATEGVCNVAAASKSTAARPLFPVASLCPQAGGAGTSPGLVWHRVPKGTASLVVVVEQDNGQGRGGVVGANASSMLHWVVADLHVTATGGLPAGASSSARSQTVGMFMGSVTGSDSLMPALSIELPNSFGGKAFHPLCANTSAAPPLERPSTTSGGRHGGSLPPVARVHLFAMPHAHTFVRYDPTSTGAVTALVDGLRKDTLCAATFEAAVPLPPLAHDADISALGLSDPVPSVA